MIGVIPCIQTFVLCDDDDQPLVAIGIGSFVAIQIEFQSLQTESPSIPSFLRFLYFFHFHIFPFRILSLHTMASNMHKPISSPPRPTVSMANVLFQGGAAWRTAAVTK